MSRRRKKNSGNPQRPEVTFIKIYEDEKNPWPSTYYMCGMCGHAISVKEVESHAKKAHNARALKLVEVDDTPLTEEAAKLAGAGDSSSELGSNDSERVPEDLGLPARTIDI